MNSRLAGLSGSMLLAVSSAVIAQGDPAPAPEAATVDGGAPQIAEVIVTARRKSEALQDVPQTVNAISGDTLEKLNIIQFNDVASVVPGLTLSNAGDGFSTSASLRGVSFNPTSQTSATVEFYINDALVESSYLFQSMFDVGQIEVLHGPQGTLRGRSAPSGSITVTTKAPDLNRIGGYISSTASNIDASNLQGAINVPLIKNMLALRVAGVIDRNDFDGVRSVNSHVDPKQDTNAYRASLRFVPIDSLDATLMFQHLGKDMDSFQSVEGIGNGYNGPALQARDRRGITDDPTATNQGFDIGTLSVNWDIGSQRLSYIGSYNKERTDQLDPTDRGNLIVGDDADLKLHFTQKQTTHELRLSSSEPIGGWLDYTAGAFYSDTETHPARTAPTSFLSGSFGSPLATPDPNAFDSRYLLDTYQYLDQTNKERSIFGSLTWHLDDKTELTTGGRLIFAENDSKLRVDLGEALIALPTSALGVPSCDAAGLSSTYAGTCDAPTSMIGLQPGPFLTQDSPKQKHRPFVYNASLSRRFSDDFMAYASVGSAWRHGVDASAGINNAEMNQQLYDITHVDPEKSRSYEIGFKSSFLDHRALLNVALYHQNFDGLIFMGQPVPYLSNDGVSSPSVSNQAFTANADAIVDGIDVDAEFLITHRWNATLAFSYADGHVDNDEIPCRDSNFDGIPDSGAVTPASFPGGSVVAMCKSNQSVSTAPYWNATLQSEYSLPLAAHLETFVRGLATYYPENSRRNPGLTVDDYTLLNLYLGIRDPKGVWDLTLFAKNAAKASTRLSHETDQVQSPGDVQTAFGASGYYATSYTPRRVFGATLRYSFGSR